MNDGLWLGVGGHVEKGETPEECIIREIGEETGTSPEELQGLKLRGTVFFENDRCDDETMYVFEAEYTGEKDVTSYPCDEGELRWVDIKDVYDLPIWEGDKEIFKCLFESSESFTLKLVYQGYDLVKTVRL